MTSRLIMVVCLLSALSFNRDCSCAAIRKSIYKMDADVLGVPVTPSEELKQLQLEQINDLRQVYREQIRSKLQLEAAVRAQKRMMSDLHTSNRKAFYDLQDAEQKHDEQLADEEVAQQALNNIMVVINEIGRLVQWKSVSLDTFLNNNFPDLTNHLKMMIATAYANAHILGNTNSTDEIQDLVSKLVNSTEALAQVLLNSTKTINQQGEEVVKLFDTIAGQAVEQQAREADLLKRALAAKRAEQDIFNRARVLVKTMRCRNFTDFNNMLGNKTESTESAQKPCCCCKKKKKPCCDSAAKKTCCDAPPNERPSEEKTVPSETKPAEIKPVPSEGKAKPGHGAVDEVIHKDSLADQDPSLVEEYLDDGDM